MALPAGRYGVTKEQLRKIKRLPINTIGMITETKEGIAIVEDGATASQLIAAGRQFWHGGKLYSADVDIAEGAAIVTSGEGKNASLMPSITDQLPGTDAEKANEVTIARVENGTTPTATINAGEQFYHLNVLYTATQDIATTDTITPNTNCRVSDSVTGQIKAVKDNIGWTAENLMTGFEAGGINRTTGQDESSTTLSRSVGYIPVIQGVVYKFIGAASYTYRVFTFNTSQVYIESEGLLRCTNGIGYYTAPTGVSYIRLVCVNAAVPDNPEFYKADVCKQLSTKADNSVIGNVEDGTTASQAYAVGEYFQRNGKLGKAINDGISNGGQFNLGTNYIETTVVAELKALADAIAAI